MSETPSSVLALCLVFIVSTIKYYGFDIKHFSQILPQVLKFLCQLMR